MLLVVSFCKCQHNLGEGGGGRGAEISSVISGYERKKKHVDEGESCSSRERTADYLTWALGQTLLGNMCSPNGYHTKPGRASLSSLVQVRSELERSLCL